MSRDIRSFFNVVSTKKGPTPVKKKKVQVISSDDEDVIPESPIPQKKTKVAKFNVKKTNDPGSSGEKHKSSEKKKKKTKEVLKPVNVKDLFGGKVVQGIIPLEEHKKKKAHEDFEKTLQQLDEDFEIDESVLDKSINEQSPTKNKTTASEIHKFNESTPNTGRKRKAEEDLDESGLDPDQERYEKKRHSAMLYKQYLNRSGPALKGQKEMPKGKPDCLKNLCFLKTGVLESMEKDDMDALVKEHGGRTVGAVSKKVNYIVVGEDPGPSKLEKARNFGIKQITEDELLDMILIKSGMEPKYVKKEEHNDTADDFMPDEDVKKIKVKTNEGKAKTNKGNTEESEKKEEKIKTKSEKGKHKLEEKQVKVKEELKQDVRKEEKVKVKEEKSKEIKKEENSKDNKKEEKVKIKEENNKKPDKEERLKKNLKDLGKKVKVEPKSPKGDVKKSAVFTKEIVKYVDLAPIARKVVEVSQDSMSWTEKYKPKDISGIIGQQGDNSNMKKLLFWLRNWYKNHCGKDKPKLVKPSPWAKNDDGAYFKCALLSGSPGVGKTTTATLVAKELGFDVVEFNASDTRSKRLLHEEVAQLLSTKSLASYFKDGSAPTKKHVLLMDEVDGMAGNEDRGGIQELIGLIKNTSVPIICMCNDRQHPKIRSLVNYCMDLRFANPRVEQIKGAMMSICFKEGVKISPDAVSEVIKGAGMDIRQTLNNLSMWTAANKNLTVGVAQKESNASKKDTVIGPWEVIRKVFSEEEQKKSTVADKSKLFFYDYSIAPLFVQENYLQVVPHCNKKDLLERVALAADAISMGDVIDKKIRSTNNWSLLESQAMYSSVLPGHYMAGHFGGQINFPGWLGKNSKRTKFQRLTTELQIHMRTTASASKTAVNLDYIYYLRDSIVRPLQKQGTEGVAKALAVMQAYNLLREDLDSILELSQWPKRKDPMASVESKVKAAFTRAYNKEGVMLPYSINAGSFKKKTSKAESDVYGDEEEEISDDNGDDDDITKDAMIKEKKKPAAKTKKETADSSKKGGAAKGKAKKTK